MAEYQTIKDRLYEYLKSKNIAPSNFEKTIGAGGSYLNNTKSIGSDKLFTISNYYKDLNIDWLVTGRGEMLKLPNINGEAQKESNISAGEIELLKKYDSLLDKYKDLRWQLDELITKKDDQMKIIESQMRIIESQQRTIEDIPERKFTAVTA